MLNGWGFRSFWQILSVLTSRFFLNLRRFSLALFCCAAFCVLAAEPNRLLLDLTSHQVLEARGAEERVPAGALARVPTLYAAMVMMDERGLTLADIVSLPEQGVASLRLSGRERASLELLLSTYWVTGKEDVAKAIKEALASNVGTFDAKVAMIVPDYADGRLSLQAAAFWSQKLIQEYPEVRLWSTARDIDYRGRHWRNPQALLRSSQSIVGLMAGEEGALWSGVTLSENPLGDGRKRCLLAVVSQAASQDELLDLSADMTQTGLRAYETLRVYKKGDVVAKARVLRGESSEVGVMVPEDVFATLARDSLADGKPVLRFTHSYPIVAPVTRGEPLGTITLLLNEAPVVTVPVVASSSVAEGGVWRRLLDTFKLLWLKRPDEVL